MDKHIKLQNLENDYNQTVQFIRDYEYYTEVSDDLKEGEVFEVNRVALEFKNTATNKPIGLGNCSLPVRVSEGIEKEIVIRAKLAANRFLEEIEKLKKEIINKNTSTE